MCRRHVLEFYYKHACLPITSLAHMILKQLLQVIETKTILPCFFVNEQSGVAISFVPQQLHQWNNRGRLFAGP